MKIDIKHFLTGEILFTHTADANSTAITLKEAISKSADLRDADLRGANLAAANLAAADLAAANLGAANLYGANLYGANLYGANLYGANLRDANLRDANLRDADLAAANLGGADLAAADLYGADLAAADLRGANLYAANLRGANLYDADLRGANLSDADLRGANLGDVKNLVFSIVPEEGAFVGWKKLSGGVIAKLEIPAEAKRTSSLLGRKNRAEFVRVLELFGAESAVSQHDQTTVYRAGEIVKPDSYNDDILVECTNGIHFFITRAEAEAY